MAPRTSWKGFIKLSLVSVPVKAFTAHKTSEEIRLNQLHKDCHARVKYQKVCPEHGELKSDQIVSGYQYVKDQYVVIDPQEVSKIRPQSDRSLNIHGFVSPEEIDPLYMSGKTYYLLPDGPAGERPYALLQQAMFEGDLCAVAQIVLSGRPQLVMLRCVEDLLVMSILHYAKTVRTSDVFMEELEEFEATKEELKLTNTLIEASMIEDFDLEKYKDDYADQLGKLIQMKIDGEEIVSTPDPEEPKIINLMDALKKSVAEAQAERKMAPSVKKSAKKKKKKSSRSKKTG